MHFVIYMSIFALSLSLYLLKPRQSKSSLPLPPGPKPLPLIGNVHQAPKSHGWRTYLKWSRDYGPVVYVNMLGQSVVILSTSEAAFELLAKRGASSSDRPRLFLAQELAMKGLNILMMDYTEQFRRHQRLQASVLNQTPVAAYLPFQVLESKQLLHDLLDKAGGAGIDVHDLFQRGVASMVHTILYGFRITDAADPKLAQVIQLNEEFSDFVQVGAHIVDTFPVLNSLPSFLAPWKSVADAHYSRKRAMRVENLELGLMTKEWNISKHLKADIEKQGLEMPFHELAFELGTMIDAALDGTTDTLLWFIVTCITQDQRFVTKARQEIDRVIGRDRLPSPGDKPALPYVTAITEEILRWRPVGPEGVPHFTKQQSTYKGYTIPANSVLIPNAWAITREEAVYGSNTDDFIPERWLDSNNGNMVKALPVAGFGYGRRICPGRHLARNTIWIIVAQLLWAFDIKAGKSPETGKTECVDPLACTYGLVMRALPFRATFEPRGPWVRELIKRECDTYGEDHATMLEQIGIEWAKG